MQSPLRSILEDIRSATSDLSEAEKGHDVGIDLVAKRRILTDGTLTQ